MLRTNTFNYKLQTLVTSTRPHTHTLWICIGDSQKIACRKAVSVFEQVFVYERERDIMHDERTEIDQWKKIYLDKTHNSNTLELF